MPIIDKYKDMGTVVMGKIESGTIREGDSLLVMPNKVKFSYSPFLRTHGTLDIL
jgi:translation elongation factor EF-1alpha